MFLPLTAVPFGRSEYKELLPCRELLPYVRCFWTSWNAENSDEDNLKTSIVIPDLCSDIIISTEGNGNSLDGVDITAMSFCGVNDRMFRSEKQTLPYRKLWGIRFYAWQAYCFSDELLSNTANGFFDLEAHFYTAARLLKSNFSPLMSLKDFKRICEAILLDLLARPSRKAPEKNTLILDAVVIMIDNRGSKPLATILSDIHAGERQLERLFMRNLSLSPKKISSLVRYQSLWQNLCRSKHFDIQDAVYEYGYYDEAHLLNDFRKFHGLSLGKARSLLKS